MKRFFLILLAIVTVLVAIPSCTPVNPPDETTDGATEGTTMGDTAEQPTEAPTEGNTEAPTEPDTEEEAVMPVKPLAITERYFIFRVWNFRILSLSEFRTIVDTVAADGFNAIKVHIPWHHAEKTAGNYDYAAFDAMIDYVVKEKGMKVAISLDMTRRKGDQLLSEEDIMRDPSGNLCMGGSVTGDRLQISFNSENAVEKCVAFYKDAVKHYDELYGDAVLFYLPAFSQYAETEYWCTNEYDYSHHAKTAFRAFLQETYGTVEALNKVLETNYTSFDEVEPPSAGSGDNFGKLWYSFRHKSLKTVIDRLAMAQEEVTDHTKFAIQLGCVYDTASALRGTYGIQELCENVDVFWMDDGPLMDHHFSMDYMRSCLPETVELAQEIDGPHQAGATPELYLAQGLTCFARGCTYVSAANWGMDADYRTYRPVWQEISSTWLGENPPAVVQPKEDTPTVEIALSDLLRRRSAEYYIAQYHKAAPDGEFVYIKVVDDLTNAKPAAPAPMFSFPGGYSGEQGKNNWYYRSHARKGMTDMTFDAANNRWQGDAEFCLISTGSMHPDTVDAALVFKAPKAGTVTCHYSFSSASDQGDGVILYIKHNGQKIEIGNEKNGGLLITYGSPADGEITLTVAEGDEIAFIINRNGTNTFDATDTSLTVAYQ